MTLAPGGLFAEATTAAGGTAVGGTFGGRGAELGTWVALAADKALVDATIINETMISL